MKAPEGIADNALVLMADIFPTGNDQSAQSWPTESLTVCRIFCCPQCVQGYDEAPDSKRHRRADRLRTSGPMRAHKRRDI